MSIIGAGLREFSAALRSAMTMALRGRHDDRRYGLNPALVTERQSLQTPTIFLHGDFHNATAWYRLSEELRDHGVGPLWAVEYDSLDDGLEQLDTLIAQIRARYARWGVDNVTVNLVGHSMGGIVATEYLRRSPEKVRRVITVASRLKPTGAFTFSYAKSRDAITHIHDWLHHHRSSIPLYSIAAKHDWLVPREAALAGCASRHTVVSGTSHLSLLYSKETSHRIAHLLS